MHFFITKNPNLKDIKKQFRGCGAGWVGGVGGGAVKWMDSRTGPNQFAPSTSSKLGAQQCIYVHVMSLTSSIYDHLII